VCVRVRVRVRVWVFASAGVGSGQVKVRSGHHQPSQWKTASLSSLPPAGPQAALLPCCPAVLLLAGCAKASSQLQLQPALPPVQHPRIHTKPPNRTLLRACLLLLVVFSRLLTTLFLFLPSLLQFSDAPIEPRSSTAILISRHRTEKLLITFSLLLHPRPTAISDHCATARGSKFPQSRIHRSGNQSARRRRLSP
jgi:hypothetical protein